MIIEQTDIADLLIMTPRKFLDERGYFVESFNQQKFNEAVGKEVVFVQDNESKSTKDVLRGLHFQLPPFEQGKLVRVVKGSVLDVAVDLRKNSPSYGKHVAVELSAENGKQFWIPPGFAHGFLTLEDDTVFAYKCTNYYHPASERALHFNDPDLEIKWNIHNPLISEKDKRANFFAKFVTPFN